MARHLRRSALSRVGLSVSALPPAIRCRRLDSERAQGELHLVSPYDTYWPMIRSFRGTLAALIFQQRRVPKGFPTDLAKVARRKLVQLNNATTLGDLVAPPGNRLEALRGDLAGKHSIRINDQWRIVFRWSDEGPGDVEIIDYH